MQKMLEKALNFIYLLFTLFKNKKSSGKAFFFDKFKTINPFILTMREAKE